MPSTVHHLHTQHPTCVWPYTVPGLYSVVLPPRVIQKVVFNVFRTGEVHEWDDVRRCLLSDEE